ncbi:Phage Terminase [compost metagenome]
MDLTADGNVFKLDGETEIQTAKGVIKPLYAVTAYGFMPEETATKHEHSDRVPYKAWASGGWCTLTDGAVTDYRYIKTHIHDLEFDEKWNIVEIDYDPYNATHFAQEMDADGYTTVEIRQGVQTLSEPTKYFRELILKGLIVHDGSPLLTWCLSNAVEIIDNNGNIKLSKKHKDDSQRIDLLAAIINALARAMVIEQQPKNVYEARGMRSLLD